MAYNIPTVKQLRLDTENGKHKFEVVSLFAGGGGSSTGYRMAGGRVLAINEFVEAARSTYAANWPTTVIIPDDIRAIDGQTFLDAIGKQPRELDILDGSPPCSGFSSLGLKDKGWRRVSKYSDTKQRNVEDLFFEYARILRAIMPKVFIAENVAGLSRGSAKGYFNDIMRELRGCNYYVECRLLNARWLGVPQSRTRAIFIGVRSDLATNAIKRRLHPDPMPHTVTLREAFAGLKFTAQDRRDTDVSRYATGRELITLKRGEQSKRYFSLMKGHPDGVAPCITATTGDIGAASPRHWDNRAYTVAEIKRIMSIPDDYTITGTYSQRVERLGRMVPPFMMRAVAKNILSLGVLNK